MNLSDSLFLPVLIQITRKPLYTHLRWCGLCQYSTLELVILGRTSPQTCGSALYLLRSGCAVLGFAAGGKASLTGPQKVDDLREV